jgi:glycosyltransferase involved in cell wall biosynthesis
MRILQIGKFYPPVRGGIEAVTFELAEGLNQAGLPTDVLCANTSALTHQEQATAGYQVIRAGSLGSLLSTSVSPMLALTTRRLVSRYDLVHVHMPNPMAALALLLARPRARVVVHWHSDVVQQRISMPLYEPLQRWMLQRADAIIATSQRYLEASEALLPWREKTHVIPIGVTDQLGRVQAHRVADVRQRFNGKRLVFALGRMIYYKGFEVLIEAACQLPDDVVVMIGGEGHLLDELSRLRTQYGVQDKVVLLGHIDEADVQNYFAACDVFCLPSTARSEAFGLVMIEAMAMGKPVVSADIAGSGVPWVNDIGVTGLGVPTRSPQRLAWALLQLLDDADLRLRLGAAARRRFLQEFRAQGMIDKTVALYDRLAAA